MHGFGDRFRVGALATALAVSVAALALARLAGADDPKGKEKGGGNAPPPVTAADVMKDPCMACHADAAKAGKHLLDAAAFARSVHGSRKMACGDCHMDFDAAAPAGSAHSKDAKTVACSECHEEESKLVAKSAHGRAPAAGGAEPRAASCVDCHGTHDVAMPSDPESRLYPLNVPATCGQCHAADPFRGGNGSGGAKGAAHAAPPVGKFTDDTHAKALLRDGLVVAPTCVTCHGGHTVAKTDDPSSAVNPARVSETCGSCHQGILKQYRRSVHGTTPRDPKRTANGMEPATCTDCHRPHGIQPVTVAFNVRISDTCARCHEDRAKTYRGTYHGRVTHLGFAGVASCDRCHTAHSILPASDPASSIHPDHRTQTCAQCHDGATKAFAAYAVHANPSDEKAWPVLYWATRIMTSLILVTWCLAGLHILLWFQRAIRERKPSAAAAHAHAAAGGRWYQRWPPFYRGLHIVVASTFLLLALTGLPLRFHGAPWAGTIFDLLGGPATARTLHHMGGAVTFGYFFVYLIHLLRRRLKGDRSLFRPATTMLPRFKDVQDVKANFRWFLFGGKRPDFDRWTYWEKFDFWAEVWGVGFIGLTGLVMWFPIEATAVVPGWGINLAHVLHSYEALLATGFIFSVHFFHANLRPGKFPMDPIIFTGRIPEEELALERPAEYARMKAEGRLESEALPPPDPVLVRRAYMVGGTLLCIGLALLFLMLSTLFL